MLKHLVVGSVILFGSSLLAGCGVNGNLTATPTGNGTYHISGTVHTSGTPSNGPSTASNSTPTSSTLTSSSPSNSSQGTVWVFSLSDLEEIYATLSYRSVGPIFPPTAIQQAVQHWEYQVSPAMLPYVPQRDASLDAALIKAIQQYRGRIISSNETLVKISSLPGWSFQRDQLPSGNRDFWWPSNNHWPTWITPIKQSL